MHDHSRVIILSCIKIRPVNRLSLLGMPKCIRLCRHYSLFITYLLKNPPTIKLCQTKGFLGLVIDGQRLQRNLYWHDWSISESLLVTKAPWNIMNKLNDFDWFVEKQYKRRVMKRKDQLKARLSMISDDEIFVVTTSLEVWKNWIKIIRIFNPMLVTFGLQWIRLINCYNLNIGLA